MFDFKKLKVFFRDGFVPFEEAKVSVANSCFLYGMGVFTGIRAHWNSSQRGLYIFRPRDHYKRFLGACRMCRYEGFVNDYSYQRFEQLLVQILRLNNIEQDAYLRVSNFTDEMEITPKFSGYKDALCIFLYPLGDYVPTGGMKCMVSSWTRIEDNSIPARAKMVGAYANTAFAKAEAEVNGYDESLVLDRNGHVVEGSAENVFLAVDGILITPPVTDNILEGVTRKTVIEIAQDEGIPVVERSVDRTELYKADEIFLTGTGAKVSPVVEVDRIKVGNGAVGPLSKRIQEIYFAAVKGNVPRYRHWLVDVYGTGFPD